MIFLDNDIDLFSIFNYIEESNKKEIFDLINFFKTNPSLEKFKLYKISEDSLKIFFLGLDELIKKSF